MQHRGDDARVVLQHRGASGASARDVKVSAVTQTPERSIHKSSLASAALMFMECEARASSFDGIAWDVSL